ncbi:hypothetical protein Aph02nite_78380 [Actinoplanes philippinensis]|uniref:Uncharacterized protein n=1 Tax=Actinoplanes philippinensis TaxID=35752 RepID=A0A1I2KD54_9ACTN|nr:hypothetical protein [Actinoplanes philippinensis]GIE81888.1 hypothetical protein Aph02nite_78380 [Actinoplanes philippinensis]SFF64393.1 hypothetical protein SAMN05421541_11667 [Actinoplanes philippinensis]
MVHEGDMQSRDPARINPPAPDFGVCVRPDDNLYGAIVGKIAILGKSPVLIQRALQHDFPYIVRAHVNYVLRERARVDSGR